MSLMLFCHLPRSLKRVTSLKQLIVNVYCKSLDYFQGLPLVKMDRIEKILMTHNDLENKIMALRCEVTDVEAKILDNFLIERLERENRELEMEIEKYRNELINLEKLHGRMQITESGKCMAPSLIKSDEPVKIQPSHETAVSSTDKTQANDKKRGKKDSKKNEKPEVKKNDKVESKKPAGEELPVDIGRLDLKVGKIVQIDKHPDADSLYVEKIDIGRPELITVVSGLVKHIAASEMLDSLVIILCNLKPAKMRGVTSEGMVMCASADGVVEVLRPPPDSVPGDIVTCPGFVNNPDPVMNPKKKIFETVAPDLKTDDEFAATYKGVSLTVENKGLIKAQTLKGAYIK